MIGGTPQDPLSYPWPLVPHGYYAPLRECDWVLEEGRNKGCPYNLDLLKWIKNGKIPVDQNPLCRSDTTWYPISLPRIAQDGRVCGGCSYYSFAKHSCFGHVAGRRPESGHSADFIIKSAGSGKGRTFSVKSPWTVTGGYKMLNGWSTAPLTLTDRLHEKSENAKNPVKFLNEVFEIERGTWQDLQNTAEAVGRGKLPRFDAGRLAGMLAEHTYWHVDADTRASLLKPLAGRAAIQSPNNLYIWRLLFKFNSKRKTYAGREKESTAAMLGAIAREAYDSKGGLRVWDAGTSVAKYFDADGSSRHDPWTLHQEFLDVMKSHKLVNYFGVKNWRYPKDGNRGITGEGRRDIPNARTLDRAFNQNVKLLRVASNSSRALLELRSSSKIADEDLSPEEMVAGLLELEQNNTDMAATTDFAELWAMLEEKLNTTKKEERELLLRELVEALPVGHLDKASPFWLSTEGTLLEPCAFRKVAASIEKNFPEAQAALANARDGALETTIKRREVLGSTDEDLAGLLGWIARGRLEAEAEAMVKPAHGGDPSDPAFRALLAMMAAEHSCDSRGNPAFRPLEEAEEEEEAEEGVDAADEVDENAETLEADADYDSLPMVQSSSGFDASPELDACYESWLTSDVAARLKKFLDAELR